MEIQKCRLCGSADLEPVINLGNQPLSGVFPRPGESVPVWPLEVVRCLGDCGLVQLRHTAPKEGMFGLAYGYRSGVNPSMRAHLGQIAASVAPMLGPSDLIVDIGANDGTLLSMLPGCRKVAIDPMAGRFDWPDDIAFVGDFFPSKQFAAPQKAKVVTSIAMFYDLDEPLWFAHSVADLLADDGVWITEQSYLPLLIAATAYDSICHEHLCYYGLRQMKYIADRVGLKILDWSLNDTNGGSVSVTMGKLGTPKEIPMEDHLRFSSTYKFFREDVEQSRDSLRSMLSCATKPVVALGASTKGNVLLHYCGLGPGVIACVGEVSPEKYGRLTSTHIPIVPEAEALAIDSEMVLVLPWHFRSHFVSTHAPRRLLFPLPKCEVA